MATAGYIPCKLAKSQVDGAGVVDFDTDTFLCLLVVAGGGLPDVSKTGVQFVSDVLAANAEVTGTGYARQTLSGLTVAFDGVGTKLVNWSHGAITFAQNVAGFTNARYIIICKDGANDAARRVVYVGDPDQTLSAVPGDVVCSAPASGTIQWQVP